ncbi:MAG: glycosyltransferase family 2 protein [Actinobacteria bacterium]|nr:glycosyltransferase family 2 protein [Actinomycetota bacterium]
MTEATRPRVSVGVPVRNGGRYLRRALSSILTQEYHDLEVVISDNASSDATSDICLEFARRDGRVRYYRNHENIGAARNYNRVFKLSRGELFKWTAHDDWCDRTFLTRCVEALDAESSAVLCYSGVIFTDESGRVVHYGSWARITTEHGPQPLADLSSPDHRRRHHALQWSCGGPAPFVFGLMRAETLARTGLVRNVPEPDRVLIGELCLVAFSAPFGVKVLVFGPR